MTEETTAESPKSPETKSSRRFFLPVAIVIVLVGAIAYIASQAGLDKALVKQAVDRFAADLAASTENSPAKMTFSYEDIRLQGGLTDRHAVIVKPVVREEMRRDGDVTLYRTDEVVLYPKSTDLRSLHVELAKPIRIFEEEGTEVADVTITQRTPITVDVKAEELDGKNYITSKVEFADAYLIDGHPENAADAWNKLTLTLAPGATLTRSMIEGGQNWTSPSRSSFKAENIKLVPDASPQDAITIEAVDSLFENRINANNINEVKLSANVGPVIAGTEVLPYGPLSAAVDLSFEGNLARSPEAFAEAKSSESSLKLETFNIKAKDAAIFATADFVSGAGDVLPVGTANITVENLPFVLAELRERGVLADGNEALLTSVLERVTGQNVAASKDISIDIKRVRDGSFQIGDTTFEEIMALLLKGALSQKMQPEPDAPEPAIEEQAPVLEMPLDTSPQAAPEPAPAEPEQPVSDEDALVPDTQG